MNKLIYQSGVKSWKDELKELNDPTNQKIRVGENKK